MRDPIHPGETLRDDLLDAPAMNAAEMNPVGTRQERTRVPRYGRAGVPETWLVDVEAGTLTAYTDSGPEGYAQQQVWRQGERLNASGVPDLDLAVNDLFGE